MAGLDLMDFEVLGNPTVVAHEGTRQAACEWPAAFEWYFLTAADRCRPRAGMPKRYEPHTICVNRFNR